MTKKKKLINIFLILLILFSLVIIIVGVIVSKEDTEAVAEYMHYSSVHVAQNIASVI